MAATQMEYLAALGCPFPSSFETRMLESRELITNYMILYVSMQHQKNGNNGIETWTAFTL